MRQTEKVEAKAKRSGRKWAVLQRAGKAASGQYENESCGGKDQLHRGECKQGILMFNMPE